MFSPIDFAYQQQNLNIAKKNQTFILAKLERKNMCKAFYHKSSCLLHSKLRHIFL